MRALPVTPKKIFPLLLEQKPQQYRPHMGGKKFMLSIANIPIQKLQIMAADFRKAGNNAQAKSIYICLMAVIKLKDGPKSDRLANNFFELAEVYAEENNYTGAQTLYERAIEIWQLSQDPETKTRITEASKRLHILSELEMGRVLREQRKTNPASNHHVA
jgi:tetratricopeptide (TPR) repeat protein